MQKMLWDIHGAVAGVRLPTSHCCLQVSLTLHPEPWENPEKETKDEETSPPQPFSASSVLQRSTAHSAAAALSGK